MKTNVLYTEIQAILMGKYLQQGNSAPLTERDWENDKKILLPKIIDLYHFAKKESDIELMEWVYHFARRIDFYHDYQKEVTGIVEHYDAFHSIQIEGVDYYLNPKITEDQRIENGQLYKTEYGIIMSGNIPITGTSSVCSNCSEPISFAQAVCYCCKYPGIGPHGYSHFSILGWKDLKPQAKTNCHKRAFESMTNDILGTGLKRAWNDPSKEMMPLYTAMGIYPTKMFGINLD